MSFDDTWSEEDFSEVSTPKLRIPTVEYNIDQYVNSSDNMDNHNRATNAARVALFKVTERLNDAERKMKAAKTEYEREFNRKLLLSTASTSSDRKTEASILTESLYDKYLVWEQLKSEYERHAAVLRVELQTLQGQGNNIRRQFFA